MAVSYYCLTLRNSIQLQNCCPRVLRKTKKYFLHLAWTLACKTLKELAWTNWPPQSKFSKFDNAVQTAWQKAPNSENLRILASELAILASAHSGTQLIPMCRALLLGATWEFGFFNRGLVGPEFFERGQGYSRATISWPTHSFDMGG